MTQHKVNYSFADDAQLLISTLNERLASINDWMGSNFLKLNEGKRDILLLGPQMERSGLSLELGRLAHNVCSCRLEPKLQTPHQHNNTDADTDLLPPNKQSKRL